MTTQKAEIQKACFARFVLDALGLVLEPEYRFAPPRRWRFDWGIPEHRVAVECEGGVWVRGRHTRGSGYVKDLEKYNSAAAMGWLVIRRTPDQLCTPDTLDLIKRAVETRKERAA